MARLLTALASLAVLASLWSQPVMADEPCHGHAKSAEAGISTGASAIADAGLVASVSVRVLPEPADTGSGQTSEDECCDTVGCHAGCCIVVSAAVDTLLLSASRYGQPAGIADHPAVPRRRAASLFRPPIPA